MEFLIAASPPPSSDYDAIVVGASLAGCAAATLLGRQGARVALVEKQPDPAAFKRVCSHLIQASAVPTLERLGLLGPIQAAGGVRSRIHARTPWGWIQADPARAGYGVNLRREVLDPLVREAAAATPGVELMLGQAAQRLLREDGTVRGVVVGARDGAETELRARLTVGADGRDSRVAELSGVAAKTLPHKRFAYGAYFEGAAPAESPDAWTWMLNPQFAAAFPTDQGLTMYVAMPTKDRLPEFRRDPAAALIEFVAAVPEPPPIRAGRMVGPLVGKLEMPNRVRVPAAPGLALIGDAALATDPLFGVGCGWALQSAEWLADSVGPALRGAEPLAGGLARYRRRHRRELRGHAFFINDYATGRRFNPIERAMMAAAVSDPEVAAVFDAYATRQIKPSRMIAALTPRTIAAAGRRTIGAISRDRRPVP
jgi:2-polyprenyl-6-methoxyphenol hydroxylase-like FAD-dependent oxidoreductase